MNFVQSTGVFLSVVCLAWPVQTMGQGGDLAPPSSPAKSMISLREIEPRTPLVEGADGVTVSLFGNITITKPGSYYLTGDLGVAFGNGITIATNQVTVDLNGFTIRGPKATGPDGSGIRIEGSELITIKNGHIKSHATYNPGGTNTFSGPGFLNGIFQTGGIVNGIRAHNVSVRGCVGNGIYLGSQGNSLAESCLVDTIGAFGIRADGVHNSRATICGNTAISGREVQSCYGQSTRTHGINAEVVANSHGVSQGTTIDARGILCDVANNCIGVTVEGYGIWAWQVASYCRARATGTSPDTNGMFADLAVGCNVDGGEVISNKYLMP